MSSIPLDQRVAPGSKTPPFTLRMAPEDKKRLRLAALQEDMPLGTFIIMMLDERQARFERAKRMQSSPLHAPAVSE